MSGSVFGGERVVTGILLLLLAYNAVCVFGFSAVYSLVDFDKHWALPEGVENNYSTRLYYSLAVQATCMAGEIYPKTTTARTVQSIQIMSAWLTTLILVVPWISAARRR